MTEGALAGKVAFVVGGSGGVGGPIAEALAAAGADVALTYRTRAARAAAVLERVRALERRGLALEMDAGHADDVARVVGAVGGALGPIDILVTALGSAGLGFFMKQDPAVWDRVWQTDLKGLFHCCRAVIDSMAERKTGRLIFISSDSGKVGQLGGAVSSAARGAINAFAKGLARELARDNITVNAVCPGPTRASALEECLLPGPQSKIWERVVESIPLKRLAEPAEVASLVVYLASPAAGFITGQVISVSGGLTMA